MTTNQINFFRSLEEQRSNLAQEKESKRANLQKEEQARKELAEQVKHNRATENEVNRNNVAVLNETRFHNRMSEFNQRYVTDRSAETARYTNLVNARTNRYVADRSYAQAIQVANRQVSENARHNQAVESLQQYSNVTNRHVGMKNAETNLINASTNRRIAQHNERMDIARYDYQKRLAESQTNLNAINAVYTGTRNDYLPLQVELDAISSLSRLGNTIGGKIK